MRILCALFLLGVVCAQAQITISNATLSGVTSGSALLSANQTFTGTNTFTAPVNFTTLNLGTLVVTNPPVLNLASSTNYAASNIVSGGVLPAGTVSPVSMSAGLALGTDGSNRIWTNTLNGVSIGGNAATATYITSSVLTNVVLMQSITNSWTANTALGVGGGTNYTYVLSGGATVTSGISSFANVSTSLATYGELEIINNNSGLLTFTNSADIHMADGLTTRSVTNGTSAELAWKIMPGQRTNGWITYHP